MREIKFNIILLSVFATIASISTYGQDGEDWKLYRPSKDTLRTKEMAPNELQPQQIGQVNIIQSRDIELLDSLKREHPTKPNGYRVQIFFGSRENAREKKVEFLKKYPETGAYISYLAPNFRLRVGDFMNKLTCEKFKKELSNDFPASYIVKDKIEFLEFGESED